MVSEHLFEKAFIQPLSDPIVVVFSLIIIGLFSFSVLAFLTSKLSRLKSVTPVLLSSIGILGTFFGIYIGLVDFDVADVDKSIPKLLEGLKIAFATSILGISASIIYKLFLSLIPNRSSEGAGATEIHKVLVDIKSSIAGDGDSSLVTQIQKLRTSVVDGDIAVEKTTQEGFEALSKDFSEFAQTMAENNTKAIIEALEGVIRDFNTQLNEQFGDNFKELNKAVAALLDWQENYKDQVEQMSEEFSRCLEGIEKSEKAIGQISENAKSIPETMAELKDTMIILNQQVQDLEQRLEAFKEMKEKASDAFPHIHENIKNLTQNLEQETTKSVTLISGAVVNMSTEMEKTAREQSSHLQSVLSNMESSIKKTLDDTNDLMTKNFEVFDEQMQDEIKRVIETMGSHLASLSNKFVEDYTPLTDKLREITSMSKGS